MAETAFLTVRCPACGAASDRVPAGLAGRTVRCPRCSARFAVPAHEPAAEPAPTVPDADAAQPTVAEAGAVCPDRRGGRRARAHACRGDSGGSPGDGQRHRLGAGRGRPGAVRGPGCPRAGRHGPRLPRAAPGLGPRPRGQGTPRRRPRRCGWGRSLRARGGDVGQPRPPPARGHVPLRPPRLRHPARVRGVRGRREPARRHPQPTPRLRGGDPRRRDPAGLGAAQRARAGSRAPGREAGERDAHLRRAREGHRLRVGPGPLGPNPGSGGRRLGTLDDGRGRRGRDARLPLARAGRGPRARPSVRPLGLRPLRARGVPRGAHVGVRSRGAPGAGDLSTRGWPLGQRAPRDAGARGGSPGSLLPGAARGSSARPRRRGRRPAGGLGGRGGPAVPAAGAEGWSGLGGRPQQPRGLARGPRPRGRGGDLVATCSRGRGTARRGHLQRGARGLGRRPPHGPRASPTRWRSPAPPTREARAHTSCSVASAWPSARGPRP